MRDSDNPTAGKGATVTIAFSDSAVTLAISKPNQSLSDTGTFAIPRSGRITITLPRSLAGTIIKNRCSTGRYSFLGAGCSWLGLVPIAKEIEDTHLAEIFAEGAMHGVFDVILEKLKKKAEALNLETQVEDQICIMGGPGASKGGTKVGPANLEELRAEMGPALLKGALQMAAGNAPVGLLLSVPGVTQVQYYYKGLPNGPEKRTFELKGQLRGTSSGPRLKLEMAGNVAGGDTNLYDEFTVNYKKEKHPFPTWSPFLDGDAAVSPGGRMKVYKQETTYENKEFEDEATHEKRTVQIPRQRVKVEEMAFGGPFAQFRETGEHRNKKKVWHEYDYYWNAHKLTSPGDPDAKVKVAPSR